jgi:hypothetical protein
MRTRRCGSWKPRAPSLQPPSQAVSPKELKPAKWVLRTQLTETTKGRPPVEILGPQAQRRGLSLAGWRSPLLVHESTKAHVTGTNGIGPIWHADQDSWSLFGSHTWDPRFSNESMGLSESHAGSSQRWLRDLVLQVLQALAAL